MARACAFMILTRTLCIPIPIYTFEKNCIPLSFIVSKSYSGILFNIIMYNNNFFIVLYSARGTHNEHSPP